jgi:hypothetical protein
MHIEDDHDSAQELPHFVAKWYAHEHEMQWAEVFCPPSQKKLFCVYGAFQNEIRHTLFELSDARVTEIKTAWWAEECQRISNAKPRHPLAKVLRDYSADYLALAAAMLRLSTAASRAANTDEAIHALMPLASAMQNIEASLFDTKPNDAAAKALAISWLLKRLPAGLAMEDQARIPMHLLARHSLNAAALLNMDIHHPLLKDWALELKQALPAKLPGSHLMTKARLHFDHARLANLAGGKGLVRANAFAHLWRAWKAARS